MAKVITYKVIKDTGDKLKKAGKTTCNFWNRFIIPDLSIVIRLDTFYSPSSVIARAYRPYIFNGVKYNLIEFNTKYLDQFSDYEIAGTLIHEVGHTLGIGWEKWETLYDKRTGAFKSDSIRAVRDLQYMFVETDGEPGTIYSHWDEGRFDQELMTGYKDAYEYVLPVTIEVMKLLGHEIQERLPVKTPLSTLISKAQSVVFSRSGDLEKLDLEYFEETEMLEEVFKSGRTKN